MFCSMLMLYVSSISGMDEESYSPADGSGLHVELTEDSGSNLVDSRLQSTVTQQPVLLDLPRDPIDKVVFDSFTYTGTLVKTPFSVFAFVHFSLYLVIGLFLQLGRNFLPCPRVQTLKPGAWEQIHVRGHCQ